MDLSGDGRKDYACVDKKTDSVEVYLIYASGKFTKQGTTATGDKGRDGAGIRFAE